MYLLLDGNIVHLQTLNYAPYPAMAVEFGMLPRDNNNDAYIALFTGGTSCKLRVLTTPLESLVLFSKQTIPRTDAGCEFVEKACIAGHGDWIRSLAVAECTRAQSGFEQHDVILASASQDRYIRTWRIRLTNTADSVGKAGLDLYGVDMEPSAKTYFINVAGGTTYSIVLDAVLIGHDDWVHSVRWSPRTTSKNSNQEPQQPLELISASADKSVFIWAPDDALSGTTWTITARVGDVGGSTLGFYSALVHHDHIYAGGYHGSMHVWKCSRDNGRISRCTPSAHLATSGHAKPVSSCVWDPSGTYLLSNSIDQTSRAFAQHNSGSWHEIARPQIHGYDLTCMAFMGKYEYICGADEKVLRVFRAPKGFAKVLERVTGIKETGEIVVITFLMQESLESGANLPALGLSNKAVAFSLDEQKSLSKPAQENSDLHEGNGLPLEQALLQDTLWPETAKLYGHGYELMAVAAHTLPSGRTLLASACKATSSTHASIRLWDAQTRTLISVLGAHSLTVTTICFSPCGKYVYSAGRDRSWTRFNISNPEVPHVDFCLVKAHARIIWKLCATFDGVYVITASRDKCVKVWREQDCVSTIEMQAGVTAIDVTTRHGLSGYLVVLGLESGDLVLLSLDQSGSLVEKKSVIEEQKHVGPVKAVCWRPRQEQEELQVATCGMDSTVRVYSIRAFSIPIEAL